MLGVQEVQAARDIERDPAAAAPPAERVCCAAAKRAALQRAEQVAALCNQNEKDIGVTTDHVGMHWPLQVMAVQHDWHCQSPDLTKGLQIRARCR